jgi:hypothetical protein
MGQLDRKVGHRMGLASVLVVEVGRIVELGRPEQPVAGLSAVAWRNSSKLFVGP